VTPKRVALAATIAFIAATLLIVTPISVYTGDSNAGCGSVVRRDPRQMRRSYCEHRGAYTIRIQLALGAAAFGAMSLGLALTRRRPGEA
jgi:hypothetical protein